MDSKTFIYGFTIGGVVMKFDPVDNKIMIILKEGESNLSNLMLKTHARESADVFKKRLDRLVSGKVISMSRRGCFGDGKGYIIKLLNINRKV